MASPTKLRGEERKAAPTTERKLPEDTQAIAFPHVAAHADANKVNAMLPLVPEETPALGPPLR
eukprot:15463099-Alexandrium_andersonii.AAC.1